MTCFRLKNGKTVASLTNTAQYDKFVKLVERGMGTDEAYAMATKMTRKNLSKFKDEAGFFMTPALEKYIRGRMWRKKCSFSDALEWAKKTGRCWMSIETAKVTMKALAEYDERKQNDSK